MATIKSIEEKAKRYDELLLKLQKAKVDDNVCDEMYYRVIDDIVPELKESEDEKIRKGIIRNLEYLMDRAEGFVKDELKERIAWLEKQGEQKSIEWSGKIGVKHADGKLKEMLDRKEHHAWSEKYIADVFEKVGLAKIVREQSNNALTIALQDAMIELSKVTLQPNPTTWSEEDEEILNLIIARLQSHADVDLEEYSKEYDWLNSPKARSTWKPSDEQMDALQYVCRNLNPPLTDKLGWDSLKTLELLYQDLKKL